MLYWIMERFRVKDGKQLANVERDRKRWRQRGPPLSVYGIKCYDTIRRKSKVLKGFNVLASYLFTRDSKPFVAFESRFASITTELRQSFAGRNYFALQIGCLLKAQLACWL